MKAYVKVIMALWVVLLWSGVTRAQDGSAQTRKVVPVEVVFLIDCSGSMFEKDEKGMKTGPIDRARQMMTAVMEGFDSAPFPHRLRVGVTRYGNADDSYGILPLGTDLDAAQDFIDDTTIFNADDDWIEGGREWVGRAVEKTARETPWATDPDGLKLIYVFGNQPPVDPERYRCDRMIPKAALQGIVVNSVRFGKAQGVEQDIQHWMAIARLGNGYFFNFGDGAGAVADSTVEATIDDPLEQMKLRSPSQSGMESRADLWFRQRAEVIVEQMRRTSLFYRPDGDSDANDAFAELSQEPKKLAFRWMERVNTQLGGRSMRSTATVAAMTGASRGAYDLVELSQKRGFNILRLNSAGLPSEMRAMTPQQRLAYIAQKGRERAQLQGQLVALRQRRAAMSFSVTMQPATQQANTSQPVSVSNPNGE